MGIVAAGMTGTFLLGYTGAGAFQVLRVFLHRQGVHIGPQGDVRPFPAGVQSGQNGRFGDHFIGKVPFFDVFQDVIPGFVFLTTQFGQAVDRPPVGDHSVFDLVCCHGFALSFWCIRLRCACGFGSGGLPAYARLFRSKHPGTRRSGPPPHRLPGSNRNRWRRRWRL